MNEPIPEGVRRFVLTSIPSVPHLETLLLLRREPDKSWTSEQIAQRLYVQPAAAQALVEDLSRAGLLESSEDGGGYRSRRGDDALAQLLVEVEHTYARELRAITALIHSNLDRKAAHFAQAFSWRKN